MFHLHNRPLTVAIESKAPESTVPVRHLGSSSLVMPPQRKPVWPKVLPQKSVPVIPEPIQEVVPKAPRPPRSKRLPILQSFKYAVCIYVLCFDSYTERLARARFQKYGWARIIMIQSNGQKGLFENVMYLDVLSRIQSEWSTFDYVGTLSYKAAVKIDLVKLDALLETGVVQGEPLGEAVFFMCARGTVHRANAFHPHFSTIWNDVVVDTCHIDDISNAFCNYWMCTVPLMKLYISYFQRILWPALEPHPLLMTDSRYRGAHSKEQIAACNGGLPFYVHTPFILERVPKPFFTSMGYQVQCMNL